MDITADVQIAIEGPPVEQSDSSILKEYLVVEVAYATSSADYSVIHCYRVLHCEKRADTCYSCRITDLLPEKIRSNLSPAGLVDAFNAVGANYRCLLCLIGRLVINDDGVGSYDNPDVDFGQGMLDDLYAISQDPSCSYQGSEDIESDLLENVMSYLLLPADFNKWRDYLLQTEMGLQILQTPIYAEPPMSLLDDESSD